jgi:hypothetical protein
MPGDQQQRHVGLEKPERSAASGAAQRRMASPSSAYRRSSWWYSRPNTAASSGTTTSISSRKCPGPCPGAATCAAAAASAAHPTTAPTARVRLAQVAAARVQRAAQRADRALVGGAMGHVGAFVVALADHAARCSACSCQVGAAGRRGPPHRAAGAARCSSAPGGPGDQRRRTERRGQRDHGRERLRHRPEQPQVRRDRQHRRQRHRAHAHRVDVVQVGALELDALGRQPSGLLITRSATTAIIQAMAMLEYRPSTSPSAWKTFISISTRRSAVLNTTHTTRPGWLCVRREKKLLQASDRHRRWSR